MSEPVHTSETPATGTPEAPIQSMAKVLLNGVEVDPAGITAPGASSTEPAAEPKPTETVDYWKQRARQNEAQAKANADAAKRLKEIEDRDLSELQKVQRDREELAARLVEVEREAVRNRVALAKGLPPEIAVGPPPNADEGALAAYADALLAWRSNQTPPGPRPDPGQGPRPSTPQADEDAEYARFFPQG